MNGPYSVVQIQKGARKALNRARDAAKISRGDLLRHSCADKKELELCFPIILRVGAALRGAIIGDSGETRPMN
jgi:hypothetical protein